MKITMLKHFASNALNFLHLIPNNFCMKYLNQRTSSFFFFGVCLSHPSPGLIL